jgi:hypothetical protein
MRKVLVSALMAVFAVGCTSQKSSKTLESPHVFPDATALEIQALIAADPQLAKSQETINAADELKDIIDMGSRLYQWLDVVNAKRANAQKLSFSTKENTRVYPIEKPSIYNAEIIRTNHTDLMAKIPLALRSVLEGKGALPEQLPISDKDFLEWGLQVSRSYDSAARWVMMSNYMMQLTSAKVADVRGYLFLTSQANVEELLKTFKNQDQASQAKIRDSLLQLCLNNQSWWNYDLRECTAQIGAAEKSDKLVENYKRNLPKAKENFDSFYELDRSLMRDDITWTSADPVTLHYPFFKPAEAKIVSYLADNIEDEFKAPGFQLRLDFKEKMTMGLSHLEYQTGVTPHAMKGKIVMDQNEPITEWSSQWTIRHEFGHLLGFPDCYVEFYDEGLKAIVNYQLDTSDLMCSRKGVFQRHHYARLKAAYYR